ncbi:MAG: hypothetical protein JWQ09_2865 [Segetibacter sp.]|nr:hypothetical protein [Segetibacter sp.]
MQGSNALVTKDVYALVTDKIIELLEAGTIPWRKPWTEAGLPRNLLSMKPYSGINLLLLNSMGFAQNLFLTWKQLKTIGGSVKKGEKGTMVVFQKMLKSETVKEGKKKVEKKILLRYYTVFNVGQCKEIPEAIFPKVEERNNEPLLECASIINEMPLCPQIIHVDEDAYYVPSMDYINMPEMQTFDSSENYYGTLFHELIHSTGHPDRIGRKEVYDDPRYGSDLYSLEELVGEMGSCYLKSYTGISIDDLSNNAAYIQGWLEVFNGDKRFVIKAASQAQKAVEYILKVNESKEEQEQIVLENEN